MQGFEIDQKAFRAQNIGRPAAHLIRELIQNAFDEQPPHVNVRITKAESGRGVHVTVSDDGNGFSDVSQIWTIFASGKQDNPTKRGRLGRGLKEFISVAQECEVLTGGKRVVFSWTGSTITRSQGRRETQGTTIAATIREWRAAEIPDIVEYLSLFIPPDGTSLSVNGVLNDRPVYDHAIDGMLPTVVYNEEGVPREEYRTTKIKLFQRPEGRWIYEMGIPVEKISEDDGFEHSIDIGQRTPLRPERDMLPRRFIHAIYAHVANALMDSLPVAELTDLWMEEAVGHHQFDKQGKGAAYLTRRFGERAARAVVNDPHDRNARAAEDGVNVIKTNHVSANVQGLVRLLPTTAELYPVRNDGQTRMIPDCEWTEHELQFARFAKWLAGKLKLQEPSIVLMDAPASGCEARTRDGLTIQVNRPGVGTPFFETRQLSNWIPVIVHEFAHRAGNGHDGVFWREVERLAGEACQAVYEYRYEVPL